MKNFYEVEKCYSLTITPNDKMQRFGQQKRFIKVRQFIYELFLSCNFIYDMIIEISEPHSFKVAGYKGPRLHAHGVILFRDNNELKQFLLNDYYKLQRQSGIDIDTINDLDVWSKYCNKQKLFVNNRISNNHTLHIVTGAKQPAGCEADQVKVCSMFGRGTRLEEQGLSHIGRDVFD